MAGLGGGDAALLTTPGHDQCTWRQAALDDFVPADHPPPFADEKFFQAMIEPGLKLRLGLQAFGFHARLAVGTRFPTLARHLISAYVDVPAREQLANFAQYHFSERHSGIVAGTHNICIDSPGRMHLRRLAGTGEFRVRRDRRAKMPRNLNLRHQSHLARLRESHELADSLLRLEEWTVNLAVSMFAVTSFG